MQEWKRNTYLLWVAVFVASVAWSSVMPFMPLFLEQDLGVTAGVSAWAGALAAVNSGGLMVMAPVWGALGDRYGRKMMMLRAGFFLSFFYVVMSFVQGPWSLLGVRTLIGFLTGFVPTAIALVGVMTPQAHVGRALALVATAGPTGNILGPMVGGLLSDLVGIRWTMTLSGAGVLSVTLLVLLAVKERFTPVRGERHGILADMKEVLQEKSFASLMVTAALFTAAFSAIDPIMVPYIKGLLGDSAPNWVAGALYSLPGMAFIIATPWWASRGEQWGYGRTVTTGLALGAGATLLLTMAVGGWDLGAIRLAQGLTTASVTPGVSALVALCLPAALRGRGFGMTVSANSVGAMLGPMVGGLLATWVSPVAVFVMSAVLAAAGALWTWTVVRPRVSGLQPSLSHSAALPDAAEAQPDDRGGWQKR